MKLGGELIMSDKTLIRTLRYSEEDDIRVENVIKELGISKNGFYNMCIKDGLRKYKEFWNEDNGD